MHAISTYRGNRPTHCNHPIANPALYHTATSAMLLRISLEHDIMSMILPNIFGKYTPPARPPATDRTDSTLRR